MRISPHQAALCLLLVLSSAAPATRPVYPATADYTQKPLRGWTILVSNDLLTSDPTRAADCLELLDSKLLDVTRVVPPKALEKIRHVPIWLERNDPKFPGG